MAYLLELPIIVWTLLVFLLGTGIGSFINVLVARLPYEKSVVWPSSRCFSCFEPIRLTDNLPIIGYLRLRGRCRVCGAWFSSRYLWVELLTGLIFVALFQIEIVGNWQGMPGLMEPLVNLRFGVPTLPIIGMFVAHACLLSLLLASSLIDLRHRIIPAQITYVGTLVGIFCSTLMPWPWPNLDPNLIAAIPQEPWILPEAYNKIPTGVTLWPFWGPLFDWAPAGSWQLGLLNGLIGAASGMLVGRGVKMAFELGMNREALGLGDADLMMMAGAFLGWQPVALSLFVGAILTLLVILPQKVIATMLGHEIKRDLPFGPGIAAGVITCWFGWPWLGQLLQPMVFDLYIIGFFVLIVGGGMLISGLFLRGRSPAPPK